MVSKQLRSWVFYSDLVEIVCHICTQLPEVAVPLYICRYIAKSATCHATFYVHMPTVLAKKLDKILT